MKGHADNTGNEFADCLAKQGNEMVVAGPHPMIPLGHNQVKSAIDSEFADRWQERWVARKDLKHSRLMMPRVEPKLNKSLAKFTRKELQLLTQIMTGHSLLGRHMSKWREISSMCRLCAEGLESPQHLLEDCPALTLEQMNFRERVGGKRWESALLSYFRETRVANLFYGEIEEEDT